MRTRIAIALGALAAVALSVIAFRAGADRPPAQAPPAQQTPACLTLPRACPEPLPPIPLDIRWQEPHLNLLLVPPPDRVDPAVGAVRAIDIAWRGGGLVGRSQQAILALAPEGDLFSEDTLVWVIRYDGPCEAPLGAPFVKRGDCSLEPHFAMIDAQTGDFLLTWTRPPGQ